MNDELPNPNSPTHPTLDDILVATGEKSERTCNQCEEHFMGDYERLCPKCSQTPVEEA